MFLRTAFDRIKLNIENRQIEGKVELSY
jgi:hypothetical protein